jgi:hypothetical protein
MQGKQAAKHTANTRFKLITQKANVTSSYIISNLCWYTITHYLCFDTNKGVEEKKSVVNWMNKIADSLLASN